MSRSTVKIGTVLCCVGSCLGTLSLTQGQLFAEEISFDRVSGEREELERMVNTASDDANQNRVMKLLDWLKKAALLGSRSQPYLFDPQELQTLVNKYKDQPLQDALNSIHKELLSRYPQKIMDSYRFIFNDAGAALGQIAILYASAREYLIFFGSPIATGGFSGRYNAEFYDIMIKGEMETVIEGEIARNIYRPGDMAHLAKGQAKGYRIAKEGWMLEYSRGSMIANFSFGVIAPAMFLTLDWQSAWAQVHDFAQAVLRSTFH